MKTNEITARTIITKSNLPDADYVINPYIGCTHACIYCYARFMKRFTGHNEEWGKFVDIKKNASDLVPLISDKYSNKSVFISSVTDPYISLEKKYMITRNILKKMLKLNPNLCIQTKSDLIIRDIDIIKKFPSVETGLSITTLDDEIRKQIEPNASCISDRIDALKKLSDEGIRTYVFIGPILPFITDWKKIIETTKEFVNFYCFENLNTYGFIWKNILSWLKKYHPNLEKKYIDINDSKKTYWENVKEEIENYCINNKIEYRMYFDHGN